MGPECSRWLGQLAVHMDPDLRNELLDRSPSVRVWSDYPPSVLRRLDALVATAVRGGKGVPVRDDVPFDE